MAVSKRKSARNKFGVLRGEGTAIRNPLKSKQINPIRIDITPKKFAVVNSMGGSLVLASSHGCDGMVVSRPVDQPICL